MAIGGSQTYTITPNNGYTIADVLVDTVSVRRSRGTYTFTNVTANHTISATFAANLPGASPSASRSALRTGRPAARRTWAGRLNTPVSIGQFGVWLVNQTTGTWYEAGYFNAVAGQTTYTPGFTVPTVPAGYL